MSEDINKRWERRQKDFSQRQQSAQSGNLYWWVTGVYNGKRFLYGAEPTQEAANNLGLQKAGVQFEVFSTTSRDRTKAAQLLKAKLLQDTHDLPESIKRLRRKPVYKNEIGRR